jgi:hypothetical protein
MIGGTEARGAVSGTVNVGLGGTLETVGSITAHTVWEVKVTWQR